jgi:predicted phosphodiesterase
MKLYAISDLHLANKPNRDALLDLTNHAEDWLILAGDIGETAEHLKFALSVLLQKFKQIVWVPGNHDLWTFPLCENERKGEDKYTYLVSVCRGFGVYTPEDDFPEITIGNQTFIISPTFTLYDYSFRPENISYERAIEWAEESGVVCTDEDLLYATPYNSITEWCARRCNYTESRLNQLSSHMPIILVNHYPLCMEHAQLWRFPRFILWCGTKRTEAWLTRYNIKIVVYGHMHIRSSQCIDGVRFEEVSLGYPRDWDHNKGLDYYLREIVTNS